MDYSASLGSWIGLLFVSPSSTADAFGLAVLLVGLGAILAVHGSLAHHLARISDLCRDLEDLYRSKTGGKAQSRLHGLEKLLAESQVSAAWSDLLRRRHQLEAKSPDDGAPIRFAELLEDHPLLPNGIRRSLMDALPALLMAFGLAGSLAALAGGLATLRPGAAVAPVVGLCLRAAFWGLLLATIAGVAAKLLEGTSRALTARLSKLVERSYRVVSHDEVSLRIAEAQLSGQERIAVLLLRLAKDLRDSFNIGMGRIESAASGAALTASDESRRALESVTEGLANQLQRRVEEQLSALRSSMQLTLDATSSSRPADGNRQADPSAEAEGTRAAAALDRAAQAVEQAASAVAGSSNGAAGSADLGGVAGVLERAVEEIDQAHQEAGVDRDSADTLAGLRDEVTRIHEQMVATAIAPSHGSTDDGFPSASAELPTDQPGESSGARSGYSALLERYQAPRFSLDELTQDVRSFDTDEAIERARSCHVASDGSLVPPPAAEAPPSAPAAPVEQAQPAAEPEASGRVEDPDPEDKDEPEAANPEDGDDQRLRLAEFLRSR